MSAGESSKSKLNLLFSISLLPYNLEIWICFEDQKILGRKNRSAPDTFQDFLPTVSQWEYLEFPKNVTKN
ncbi:hypothetical protein [uncultured Flavobacterium sp.]|uniref:hypothetical protein n=1 Tax=uncultured Flavobacterium sp. TaxID=165435 RepID=UPI0025FCF157|nr:hypothetical protein [uncultured Flavobacterium sp.]